MFDPFSLLFWIITFTGYSNCVEVHFENKDGGFFLKHFRQHSQTSDSSPPSNSLLSTDRFAVFQTSQPVSIRATYGPFSTKQTVPARYVMADPLPINTTSSSLDIQEFTGHHLDMSAHIVKHEIPRDSPVLRVLFHTGTDPAIRQPAMFTHRQQKLCIILHATWGNKAPLSGACSPDGEDGVCLAQITIPASWWPSLPPPDKEGRPGKSSKSPPRVVQVAYSVLQPHPNEEQGCQPKVQFQPSTILGLVTLTPGKSAYKELKLSEGITMLIPHPALFPLSRIHVPIFIEKGVAKMLTAIIIRGRVKNGVKFINAVPSEMASSWNVSVEMNPRQTGMTINVVKKEDAVSDNENEQSSTEVIELFTMLVEISGDAGEGYDGAKVVWSTRVEPSTEEEGVPESHKVEGRKTTTKFEIQKDDIQAVVPISKNWEILNTAVLTGKQISQAMKVLIVSQAGKAADVTFQASCHSEDDSVLKVSSSCSSVYVDGSEARGSVNGSVLVKYGTYTGLARFTVWMPEFPLELQVGDTRLSQVKSWRVPDFHNSGKNQRKRRSYANWSATGFTPEDIGNGIDKVSCRLRYQQTPVDVYAHFMASDHDTGRITYLVNRRTWLRVTDLVQPLLRVSDPRIASLHGRILQGRSMGRTEVQVLSPITGRVIGAKEIRVGNDKIGISKLAVQVVSGLQLSITPDASVENSYIAETSVTRKLTAQYQEGLLDIEIEFTDGSKVPLRDVADTDYHLVVESLDPEVVAFAPMVASHHPRVIAVGEGSGDLLQVTLLLPEECRTFSRPKHKGIGPLASATATVTVDFSLGDLPHRPDILQNDGGSYGGSKTRDFTDLRDILKGPSIKDNSLPNVQARQHHNNKGISHLNTSDMTPLEISMYVLLATFCFAIVIFVASCIVYASKFKPTESSLGGINTVTLPSGNFREKKPRETTTNAHDWVWLGRSTMDMNSNRSSAVINNNEMRITANPLNLNYCEPDDCVPSSFSNPTHIELPSSSAVENQELVDSTTYCKSRRSGGHFNHNSVNDNEITVWTDKNPPPSLPPHGPCLPFPNNPNSQELNGNEDYRPPIPPHRNLCINARNTSIVDSPPVRRHHHHHRGSRHQQEKEDSRQPDKEREDKNCSRESRIHMNNINYKREPRAQSADNKIAQAKGEKSNKGEKSFRRSYHEDYFNKELTTNAFEFDDMPTDKGNLLSMGCSSEVGGKDEADDDAGFVQVSKNGRAALNGNNSSEVKRATIVGNPMFSAEDLAKEEINTDLSGLEELGMDYEQIMHYFKNLKESNA